MNAPRFALAAAFALSLGVCADAALMQTLDSTADTFVNEQFPGTTSGSNVIMRAQLENGGNTRASYVRFDLGAIAASDVTSAILTLDFAAGNADGTVGVFGYTDGETSESFDEATLNWNTAVANGDLNASGSILKGTDLGDLTESGTTAGSDWTIDVTAFVQGDSNGVITFIVRANSFRDNQFATKESTTLEAPRLSVEYIPEPASVALLGLGGLAMLARRRA